MTERQIVVVRALGGGGGRMGMTAKGYKGHFLR